MEGDDAGAASSGAASSGVASFGRNPTKGMHDATSMKPSTTNGNDLAAEKSMVPTTGPARFSVPASVPLRIPFACSRSRLSTKPGAIACTEE